MTMMSSMNNFSRLTEGRFLSPDCTVENPVLREVIRKIPTSFTARTPFSSSPTTMAGKSPAA